MSQQFNPSYGFGSFRVVPSERLLLCNGKPVALPPKAFDTLVILVENNGHAVKKEDLLRTLWPDAFVEESNLNHYVSLLRKALGDSANGERFIETVAKYGFRFIADVRETSVEPSSLLIRKHTRTRVVLNEEQLEKGSTASPVADLGVRKDSKRSRFVTGLALALIALAAIAGVTYMFFSRHAFRNDAPTAAASAPEIRSIAVLPFKRLGAESNDDYLGLSLADSLITKLGQIRKLNVRPTSAIQKYDADARDPAQIGRELKVDVVLDGRFQKSGDQIRVTVQLVNAKDRTLLWTGEFDERLTSLLAVEDSISGQAAQAMKLQLTAWERERLAKPSTANPEAYQAYLKGRYFWNKRTVEGFKKGIEYFQQAIDLDPNYAQAYSGLADCQNLLSEYNGASPEEAFAAAKQAAKKALEIDESLAEAHTSLAYILVNHEWDWAGAEREYQRAIELNPNYATAHQWYAEYLMAMRRDDEGQVELARALEIDPVSLIINAEQGLPFIDRGEYDRAIEHFQKAVDLDASFAMAHRYLWVAYELGGRPEQAFVERLKEAKLNGTNPAMITAMKNAYNCCGLPGVLRRELTDEKARRRTHYFSPYEIARTCALVGDKQQALTWLEQAYKERDRYVIFLGQDQNNYFATLRSDPRFGDLLRRMSLAS